MHRDLELVTQSLTRHFALEYETTPSTSFFARVKEFIKWFANLLNDLHKYITGDAKAVFKVSQINQNTKLSEIARILNTTDVSWHGHPDPLNCPKHIKRRSLAFYYYTKPEVESKEHSTIYVERPGEKF